MDASSVGAALRIDVDRREKDRADVIPSDNPFNPVENARGEVWDCGLWNQKQFGVEPKTYKMFAAENGWESWEMVHRDARQLRLAAEGRPAALRTEVAVGPTPILAPFKGHPNRVIGGPVVPLGETERAARGVHLRRLHHRSHLGRSHRGDSYGHQSPVDTDRRIVSFTQGPHGELYVLDFEFTGRVYELPSNVPEALAEFPRRLSDTGSRQ